MNNNKKSYDYGKCHVCGEQMQEQRINQTFWVRSPRVSKGSKKLVAIEPVPVGVCHQCGEKIVKADVGRQPTALIANLRRVPKRKTIAIPVIRYVKAVA
jgi:ssDNA-binding Zn-finger/Zn-ribbon topoisomerase 1